MLTPLLAAALAPSAASGLPVTQAQAQAQPAAAWPTKPVRVTTPFPVGSGPDAWLRVVTERLARRWGQPVIVENKPGANGFIAIDAFKRGATDGHDLIQLDNVHLAAYPHLFKKLPYDPVKDFAPLSRVANVPNLLVAHPSRPYKTVQEMIAYAKKHPGEVTYGSPGSGASPHVSGALFQSMTGGELTHVPYKGSQFAIPDLVGGSIQLMFDNMPSALPMAREGKIRAIAVTTAKRSSAAPEIPTIAESIPGFEATTWFAMFAPAGTPKPVIDRLNAEVLRVFRLPDVAERLKTLGLEPVLSSPEELAAYQATEITKWTKVVKESGAKAE